MLLMSLEWEDEDVALEDIRMVLSEDEPLVCRNFPVDSRAADIPV